MSWMIYLHSLLCRFWVFSFFFCYPCSLNVILIIKQCCFFLPSLSLGGKTRAWLNRGYTIQQKSQMSWCGKATSLVLTWTLPIVYALRNTTGKPTGAVWTSSLCQNFVIVNRDRIMWAACPLQAGAATEQQQLHVSRVRQGQREERAEDLDEEEAEGAAGGLPETPGEPATAGTPAFLSDDGQRALSLYLHFCCFFCLLLHRTFIQD